MVRFGENPKSDQVRRSFLEFFGQRGHSIQPSAPLIPQNDPTLTFTNAGMVPFKDVFTGKETRPFTRATSSQKCIRISGKHNDLENVGVTARHHTFFEMLGNFSFGDYFKEEAIVSAWDLLTKEWALPTDKLVITVFGGEGELGPDDEARALWRKVTGFGDERIIGLGMKDNFWQMGDTGPCGPCTEIHFFHGDNPDLSRFTEEPTPDGRGWMEIWNLVFMQYERSLADGKYALSPLPKPCVDTGAGLERVSSVLQGKTTNYDTDLLRSLVEKASEIAQKPYRGTQGDDDVSMRVIADHARTTAFLIAENVFPDRAAREYVLRRVMRRAIRHGHRLGIQKPFIHLVADEVVNLMGEAYPELQRARASIVSVSEGEEVRFRETIDRGLRLLDEEVGAMRQRGETVVRGDLAFKLYDTFGFPLDLTQVIADERALQVDVAGYNQALEEQRARSEGSKVGDKAVEEVWRAVAQKLGDKPTDFIGYSQEDGEGTVLALVQDGKIVDRVDGGDVTVVLDRTPFYAESGGQVGDVGWLTLHGTPGRFRVRDTHKPYGGLFAHEGTLDGLALAVGDKVRGEVDHAARAATRRNHSATHLLHWALRKVLGPSATQKGSLVGPQRLRFDFAHQRPVTDAELATIEDLVNEKILLNAPVMTEVLPIDKAREKGAVAMFGEKYGDTVRVLTMTPDSVEFCGGTHARATGDIGFFKVLTETGVAAGVRRIEAATGHNAAQHVRALEMLVMGAARALKTNPADLQARLDKTLEGVRALEKELADLKRSAALGGGASGGGGGDRVAEMLAGARAIDGAKVLAVQVDGLEVPVQRELADKLRDTLGDAVVLVSSVHAGKVQLVLTVSKALTSRFKAGDLIKPVAASVGGSGGGRPDMAQAGGTSVDKAAEALTAFYGLFAAS
jgi:alanyl-tRNA synthetase